MPRAAKLYAEDIVLSIDYIRDYVSGMQCDLVEKDQEKVDAILRRFQIIGEAARLVEKELGTKYPNIPWRDVIGMRNFVVHDYFNISFRDIWQTIKTDLPQLKSAIQKIQEEQGWNR